MGRRLGLRLAPARAVDEFEDALHADDAAPILDEALDRRGEERGEGEAQPPAFGATPAATPSR